MAEIDQTPEMQVDTSAGHLSVYVEGAHPREVSFLFAQQPKRLGLAFGTSFVLDVLLLTALVMVGRFGPRAAALAGILPENNPNIIWLSEPGPGGGGGGGGNRMKEPPRKAEMPGKDKVTVPVAKPPTLSIREAKNEPNPLEQLNIPAKSLASAQDSLPGLLEAPPGPPTLSQGSGSGGGSGTGTGTGIGPGTGSGLGPGSGGGTGGGVYQPGSGVSSPIALQTPKPQYTSDAMRAKVQGVAVVGCIVETDGHPSNCHVVRSLDPHFGLDQQAIVAASNWRFRPGMRQGEPVRVEITIEMSFTLR